MLSASFCSVEVEADFEEVAFFAVVFRAGDFGVADFLGAAFLRALVGEVVFFFAGMKKSYSALDDLPRRDIGVTMRGPWKP